MNERKMRYSRQRERIYQYLCSTQEHPSADIIYQELKGEMSNLSLGTVYRNLRQLEEMGKVQRIVTPQNVERYDARCDDHAHFVCEGCGMVKDLSVVDPKAAAKACGAGESENIRWLHVTFGGLCGSCSSAAAAEARAELKPQT